MELPFCVKLVLCISTIYWLWWCFGKQTLNPIEIHHTRAHIPTKWYQEICMIWLVEMCNAISVSWHPNRLLIHVFTLKQTPSATEAARPREMSATVLNGYHRKYPTHIQPCTPLPCTICQFYWIRNWMFYLPAIKLGICMILLIIAIVWHSYLTMKLFCHHNFRCGMEQSAVCQCIDVVVHAADKPFPHTIRLPFKWCWFGSSATRWQMHLLLSTKWLQPTIQACYTKQKTCRWFAVLCVRFVFVIRFYSRLILQRLIFREMLPLIYKHRSYNTYAQMQWIGLAWHGFAATHTHFVLMIQALVVNIKWIVSTSACCMCPWLVRAYYLHLCAKSGIVCYSAKLYSCMF